MEMLVVVSAGLLVGAAIEVAVTVSKVVISWTRCMLRRLQAIHLGLTVIIIGTVLSEPYIHSPSRKYTRCVGR